MKNITEIRLIMYELNVKIVLKSNLKINNNHSK